MSTTDGTTMDKVSVYGTQMGNSRERRDRDTAKAGSARNKNRGLAAMRTEKKNAVERAWELGCVAPSVELVFSLATNGICGAVQE